MAEAPRPGCWATSEAGAPSSPLITAIWDRLHSSPLGVAKRCRCLGSRLIPERLTVALNLQAPPLQTFIKPLLSRDSGRKVMEEEDPCCYQIEMTLLFCKWLILVRWLSFRHQAVHSTFNRSGSTEQLQSIKIIIYIVLQSSLA